jgi:hypothetical protein
MRAELKKMTNYKNEEWFYIYIDDICRDAFRTLDEAKKVFDSIGEPVTEVLETKEV